MMGVLRVLSSSSAKATRKMMERGVAGRNILAEVWCCWRRSGWLTLSPMPVVRVIVVWCGRAGSQTEQQRDVVGSYCTLLPRLPLPRTQPLWSR